MNLLATSSAQWTVLVLVLVVVVAVWVWFVVSTLWVSEEEYRAAGSTKGWWVFWSVIFGVFNAFYIPLLIFFLRVRPRIRRAADRSDPHL